MSGGWGMGGGSPGTPRAVASSLPHSLTTLYTPFTFHHFLCSVEDKVRTAADSAKHYASAAVDAAAKEMHGDTHIVVDFYTHNLQPWVKCGKEQALYLGRILAALAQQLGLLPSNFSLFCVRCAGKVSPLDASLQGKLNKDEQTAYAAQGILLIELSQGIVKAVWTRSAAILVR